MPCESRGGLQFHIKKVAPTVDICGLKPKGNDDDSPAIGPVTHTDDGSVSSSLNPLPSLYMVVNPLKLSRSRALKAF